MKYLNKNFTILVMLITLISFCSCAVLDITESQPCKNHTNINTNLKKYITKRYLNKKLLRLGIFPFSVPANFTAKSLDRLDFGIVIAQKLQPYLLSSNLFTTVELLDYPEWSGKKQEFFANNLQAIEIARNIGLDFVVLGYLSPQNHIEQMTVYSKIIDVNTGITVYYGETTAFNEYLKERKSLKAALTTQYQPSDFRIDDLTQTLMTCHGKAVIRSIK